jgi:predicted AAA+ superfamily ATPase
MINAKVKRMLMDFNPFWKAPLEVEYRDRSCYPGIWALVDEPQIISLCGLRRVGKTTLMQKLVQDLAKKHPADSILYFSFDDFQGAELADVLDAFEEIHGKKPKFLFFDEVQKLQNWAEKVKILYDTKKYKIFVSGSESLFLRHGARESLAGRIYEFEIKGLSFSEYLGFVGKKQMAAKPQLYGKELKIEFGKYLMSAGFPELIGKDDAGLVRLYLQKMVEKIIFVDLRQIYPIEDPAKLSSMLDIIISNPGMLVDFSSLSQELGISRQTISKYFYYLESGHLVVKLYNYSRNKITSEKRLKKFYPAFLSPALLDPMDEAQRGKLIETFCVLNTEAKFFWRDKFKDEVDIILQHGKNATPIEIKYRNRPEQGDGLEKFCRKYPCQEAIIVTKDVRKITEGRIRKKYIPAFEFLLGV